MSNFCHVNVLRSHILILWLQFKVKLSKLFRKNPIQISFVVENPEHREFNILFLLSDFSMMILSSYTIKRIIMLHLHQWVSRSLISFWKTKIMLNDEILGERSPNWKFKTIYFMCLRNLHCKIVHSMEQHLKSRNKRFRLHWMMIFIVYIIFFFDFFNVYVFLTMCFLIRLKNFKDIHIYYF